MRSFTSAGVWTAVLASLFIAVTATSAPAQAPPPAPAPNGQWNFFVPGQSGTAQKQVTVTIDVERVTTRNPTTGKPTATAKSTATFNFAKGSTAASVAFQMKRLLEQELAGVTPTPAIVLERETGLPDIFVSGADLAGISASSSEDDAVKVNMAGNVPQRPTGGSFFIELEVLGGNGRRGGVVTFTAAGLPPNPGPPLDPTNLAAGQQIRSYTTTLNLAANEAGQQVIDRIQAHLTALGWSVQRRSNVRLRLSALPGSVDIASLFLSPPPDSDDEWRILFTEE